MSQATESILSTPLSIAPAKSFTYPTRLANAYTPEIQIIDLPGYQVIPPPIEICVRDGITDSLGPNATRSLKGWLKTGYKTLVPKIRMDDAHIFDARYEDDDNIAHILDSVISALLAAKSQHFTVTVILKAQASAMARDVFDLLGIQTLCTNAEVIGKRVLVRQPNHDRFYGGGLYGPLFKEVTFSKYQKRTSERIFIARKVSRRIVNEEEVEKFLGTFGFVKVYFEDIPVFDQWSLARNARAVVGIHGAALSSLFFNTHAATVIELFHPGFVTNWARHITNGVGGTWFGVTGQLPPDIIKHLDYRGKAKHFAFHDIRIDIEGLRTALEHAGIA
jgi:capsular polysaccharide biosynthesis protein